MAHNTAYTVHFVRSNFGFAETSYMLETLYYMLSIIKLDVGLTILLNGEWEDYGDVVSSFYKYGVRV